MIIIAYDIFMVIIVYIILWLISYLVSQENVILE